MRRTVPLLLALLTLALSPSLARAADASPTPTSGPTSTDVVVLKAEGAIDRPLWSYLNQRLDQAEADGSIVVLQTDTSGTLGEDGVALGNRLVAMRVPVLVWVGPAPAKAAGAVLLLMYASSLAFVWLAS